MWVAYFMRYTKNFLGFFFLILSGDFKDKCFKGY